MLCKSLFTTLALTSAVLAAPTAQLPEVTTTASTPTLREQQPADESGRPEWTSSRRFSTTRVYIQNAPGEVSFEQWLRYRDLKHNEGSQARFYEEVEIGLPYRMQLDIYEKWVSDEHRRAHHDELSFELRWAPFNWGKFPLNPTLYLEYAQVDHDANALESKLLLGQDFTPRLHWGMNFVWERGLSHDRTNDFQISQGIGYTIIDQRLNVGVEMLLDAENNKADRNKFDTKFLIGPSIQIKPTNNTHLDFVALIGTNDAAPNLEMYVIFGIEFGRVGGSKKEEGYTPAAGRIH
ncbi:MAG TPA: transporter [Chthoniobacteraceae bacterium]|jgi:hypothetical protein|nr:transporter [Chthoniobacteraceae bacterium]